MYLFTTRTSATSSQRIYWKGPKGEQLAQPELRSPKLCRQRHGCIRHELAGKKNYIENDVSRLTGKVPGTSKLINYLVIITLGELQNAL